MWKSVCVLIITQINAYEISVKSFIEYSFWISYITEQCSSRIIKKNCLRSVPRSVCNKRSDFVINSIRIKSSEHHVVSVNRID